MLARTQSMNRNGGATTTSTSLGTAPAAALRSATSFSTEACVPLHFQFPPTKKLPVEAAQCTRRREAAAPGEASRAARDEQGVGWGATGALLRISSGAASARAAWARTARAGAV